jgi:hypothetical protein
MLNNDQVPSVYYALHVRRKNGHQQIEHNRRGALPKAGELIALILSGEPISLRVLNVITEPAKQLVELVHNVYAIEV